MARPGIGSCRDVDRRRVRQSVPNRRVRGVNCRADRGERRCLRAVVSVVAGRGDIEVGGVRADRQKQRDDCD